MYWIRGSSEINQEISKLSVQFSQNLLAETNNFEIILGKDDLKGLPEDIISLAKEEADNKYKKTSNTKYNNKYILVILINKMVQILFKTLKHEDYEKDINLDITIADLKNKYNCKVGYSGHESGLAVSYAASMMGWVYRKTSPSLSSTQMDTIISSSAKSDLIFPKAQRI